VLLVEGPSVGDLEGRKAVFWAVLKDVPVGPSKRSRVCGLLKGVRKLRRRIICSGTMCKRCSEHLEGRSLLVSVWKVSRELQQITEGLYSQIPRKLLKPRNSMQEFTCILGVWQNYPQWRKEQGDCRE
jgi:hypothetical protein